MTIETKDGLKLKGWFTFHPEDANMKTTVIFFHENAGNIGYRIDFMEWLYYKIDCNFLLIGYRGYGHSEGSPSEQGLMIDGEAIFDWALTEPKIDNSNIFVYGRSMGGQVAIYVAYKYQTYITGLILENTFSNISDLVDSFLGIFSFFKYLAITNVWPSDQRI